MRSLQLLGDEGAFFQDGLATFSQAFSTDDARRSQNSADTRRDSAAELHIEQSFDLPSEIRTVCIPPYLFHPRHQIGIDVF